MSERYSKKETVKLYVPKAAAERDMPVGKSETVIQVLKRRAADHADGYTVYEAIGGWEGMEYQLMEEEVYILEVHIRETDNMDGETFAKVNARWLLHETEEQMVMATVDDMMIEVS